MRGSAVFRRSVPPNEYAGHVVPGMPGAYAAGPGLVFALPSVGAVAGANGVSWAARSDLAAIRARTRCRATKGSASVTWRFAHGVRWARFGWHRV